MAEIVKTVNGVDVTMMDCRATQDGYARCELCRRAWTEFDLKSDAYTLWCFATPHSGPFGDVYERDDKRQIEPWDCESCGEYDPRGLTFPLECENVLVEQPDVKEMPGTRIGSIVTVKPCNPDFGGKTYLGVFVGQTPTQIELQYDRDGKELMVYNQMSNPLIVIPELSATVYGYESWWKVVRSEDDLKDITDEEILSQPYMVALAKLLAEADERID